MCAIQNNMKLFYAKYNMFKSDINDLLNYVCNYVVIDNCEHMTIGCKWQEIVKDSGYNDFNMWVPLGCKIVSRMFNLLTKTKSLCRGD